MTLAAIDWRPVLSPISSRLMSKNFCSVFWTKSGLKFALLFVAFECAVGDTTVGGFVIGTDGRVSVDGLLGGDVVVVVGTELLDFVLLDMCFVFG